MRLFAGLAASTVSVAAYGTLARLLFEPKPPPYFVGLLVAMTIAFIFVLPFAMGALAVFLVDRVAPTGWPTWILAPWLPVALTLLAFGLARWEGTICLVLLSPAFFTMSTLGGITMGLIRRHRRGRGGQALTVLMVMPFILAPLESRAVPPLVRRTVSNEVVIQAGPGTVWANVAEVRAIAPSEYRRGFFQAIGIPSPLEARLDRPGGTRFASFREGIRFREPITTWEPGRHLAFRILLEPGSIGPGVLDEHVEVGGRYFNVEEGRFDLEPLPSGATRLRLSSTHRLSTTLNPYAGLWTDAIMSDLQRRICGVIKARSEAAPRPGP